MTQIQYIVLWEILEFVSFFKETIKVKWFHALHMSRFCKEKITIKMTKTSIVPSTLFLMAIYLKRTSKKKEVDSRIYGSLTNHNYVIFPIVICMYMLLICPLYTIRQNCLVLLNSVFLHFVNHVSRLDFKIRLDQNNMVKYLTNISKDISNLVVL